MEERKFYSIVMNYDKTYHDDEVFIMQLTKSELNILKWLNQIGYLSVFRYYLLKEEEKLNPAEMKFDW